METTNGLALCNNRCLITLLIFMLAHTVLISAKCSERHVDSFYACVKANDDKHYAKLTDEFVASIERRSDKCFNADGQCKLKGRWNTAHDLCIGAKVCQCTFCDILFDIVTRVSTGDAERVRQSDVCIKRRIIDDLYYVAERCIADKVGLDVQDILKEHMPDRAGAAAGDNRELGMAALHQYMLARTHVDRCMHFPHAEAKGRATDECWWKEADGTPIGRFTCGIALTCAKQASDAECSWYSLRKTLSSLCTCLKRSRRDTAAGIAAIGQEAVRLAKGGSAAACIAKGHEVNTFDGIVRHMETIDHALAQCIEDRPPFTTNEMFEAMCESAAATGKTWNLRHGMAQGTNFFAMYATERVLRYCTCF